MKKLFLFTVLLAFALSASAQFFTYDGITYRITSDIKLTVEVDKGLNSPIVTIPSTVIGNDHKPYTVTSIGDFAFSYYTNLTEITISNTVTSIGVHAFEYCKSLESVSLGSNMKSIGNRIFTDCTALTKLISNAIVPPKCDAGAFDGIDKEKCTLFVPDEAVDSYKNAEQWKDFFSIQPTSIGETVANEGDSNIIGSVSVYNASGSLVKTFKDPNTLEDIITTLASGEYIIRYNGGALKILKD